MTITAEELQKLLDDAYQKGKADGLASDVIKKIEYIPMTYPPYPWQVTYTTFGTSTGKAD